MIHENILSEKYYDDNIGRTLVKKIREILKGKFDDEAIIYYDYLLNGSFEEDLDNPRVMVVSKKNGIILFDICEYENSRSSELESSLDNLLRKEEILYANFLKNGNSIIKQKRGRGINFSLQSFLYAPEINLTNEDEFILTTDNGLESLFSAEEESIGQEKYQAILSVIDYSGGMLKTKERNISEGQENTKGKLLNKLDREISNFDNEQKYAALSDLNGPQRIRGLAGSGKTVILCMKAAHLHLKYPNRKILYTFMTKSLYDYIESLITRFYKLMGDGSLPDFENSILIRHSWGGQNIAGVYYEACRNNNIVPLSYLEAKRNSNGADVFNYVCTDLLVKTNGVLASEYDFVLIDEAQDFRAPFYQICRELTSEDNLVWGYDNLQNIFDVEIQDTMETFSNDFGAKGINLSKLRESHPEMNNDVVLPKSYRNAKEILVTAHAIGFGIYNSELIQMFENNQHWEDLGYVVEEGNSNVGDRMIVSRPEQNSPLSISNEQSFDELIEIYSAENMDDEAEWVVKRIEREIKHENLRPEDIVVISLDDRYAKRYFERIAMLLQQKEINSYNLTDDYYSKGFIKEDAVTLSTVYKAKGNETGYVFVIGCDVFENKKNDIRMRNKVFTAFTRSKGWLRISGVDIQNSNLSKEINTVKENNLKLIFDYTDMDSRVIKRDRLDKTSHDFEVEKAMSKMIENGISPDEYRERFEKNERR